MSDWLVDEQIRLFFNHQSSIITNYLLKSLGAKVLRDFILDKTKYENDEKQE